MSKFDIIVLILLGISGAVGFFRGAIREVAALVALIAAGAAAIFGLPAVGPVFRTLIGPDWLGTVAALVVVFGVVYVGLRVLGSMLARQIRDARLGLLDQSMGALIGLGRGLIVLGVLYLLFNAATPQDLRPGWITSSTTWPLAGNMGRLLERLVPQGLDIAERLKPSFDRAVGDGSGDKTTTEGYEAGDLERRR